MTINYITNLDVNEHAGGWLGMNHHIYNQLATYYDINLLHNINPPYSPGQRYLSKIARSAGMKGSFPAFTDRRLNKIKIEVEKLVDHKAAFDFYHGSTPWLHSRSNRLYVMYLDACFATYMQVYQHGENFSISQLKSLYKKDAEFLNEASAVFFSSRWALEDAKKRYRLKSENFHVVGLGGGLEAVSTNNITKSPYFLFVGLDFYGKGGEHLMEAFLKLQIEFPEYHLKIVGQKPPGKFLTNENVHYEGLINKKTKEGKQQITKLFSEAYCFVLPTQKDLTPLVIVEAGSVGCPVISTNSFGIPEIVKNDETGILIDPAGSITEQLYKAMTRICADRQLHRKMSMQAIDHIHKNFTWNKVGERIYYVLKKIGQKEVVNA